MYQTSMANPTGEVRRVADEILTRIISGAYPGGLRLPSEVDLASQFSCGRSTVREALRHLSTLGVVHSRRGSGAMVLDFRREGTPALLPWYLLAGRFDRPLPAVVRELLSLRTMLAAEAVRLAALYSTASGLAEARRILGGAPALEVDPVAHTLNELDLFRAIVVASGMWPAVWLANVFWAPMRELHSRLAAVIPSIPAGYQAQMENLLALIEARDAGGADRLLRAWFSQVDADVLGEMERVLGAPAAGDAAPGKAPAS